MKILLLLLFLAPFSLSALEIDADAVKELNDISVYYKANGSDGVTARIEKDGLAWMGSDSSDAIRVDFPEGKRADIEKVRGDIIKFVNSVKITGNGGKKSRGRYTFMIFYRNGSSPD
ncbi:MAG: hypothetical protein AAB263_21390 [Planctomycetota bacterium]